MNQNKSSRGLENLSPVCLIRMLVRHLWMLIAAALVFAMGASLAIHWFHQPEYRASMTYAVTSRETNYIANRNLTATREVAAVMSELLETNVITEEIRGYSDELADFNGTIQAAQVGESNLLTVTSTADRPEAAFRSLQALIEVFPSLTEYLSDKCVVHVIQNPAVSAASAAVSTALRYSSLMK